MVQFAFYAWAIVALALAFYLLNNNRYGKGRWFPFAACVAAWIAYIMALSATGVLEDFSFPPRLPLLIVIPAITACIVFTGRSDFRNVLIQTPLHLPVYLQSFRVVVELLIYGAFVEGVFPERATFEGINFDIVVGTSAPVMAFLYQRGIVSGKALFAWNIISLLILCVTVYAFISTYYFTDYVASTGSTDFIRLPYLLLASVLLPVAVLFHVFSIRQIRLLWKQQALQHTRIRAGSGVGF